MTRVAAVLPGSRFGLLVAEERIRGGNHPLWRCRCDCGRTSTPDAYDLTARRIRSCGCARARHISEARKWARA